MNSDHKKQLKAVFNELKDFQIKTVDYAYDRLKENRRYLVADEVGLGKTKIAKGVIAKALIAHEAKINAKTFRVFYICSNQALANQNLKDLNIFNDSSFIDTDLSRLIYLAKKTPNNSSFMLSSLTPSTSLKPTLGTGVKYERMLIYTVLATLENIKNSCNLKGLKWLLIGGVTRWNNWENSVNYYFENNKDKLVDNISNIFRNQLMRTEITDHLNICLTELDEYPEAINSVFDLVIAYSHLLRNKNKNSVETVNRKFPYRNRLVSFLRKTLVEISVENLQADLFILDEFQRFKELVGIGNKKDSEASRLARKIFSIKEAKCLMLSATPFRMYTSRFDEIDNEDHYSELTDLLVFLNGNKPLDNFEKLRNLFSKALQNGEINNTTIATKIQLENLYKSVLCRTEKMIVSEDKNNIVLSKDQLRMDTQVMDLETFIHTDQIFQTIKRKFDKRLSYSIDYNKSVPFPMSFMDGYKSKIEFTKLLNEHPRELSSLIRERKKAWINLDYLQNYKLAEYPNAKFRQLLEETVEKGDLWKLLWLPPSVPLYKGMGVYSGKSNLSKTLIFSRWVMVPKMIAGLLSYEVERKTLANKLISPDAQPHYTPKLKPNGKHERRKPLPILRLQLKNSEPTTLRSFTLLYPSKTLTRFDFFNSTGDLIYKDVREERLSEIDDLLSQLKDYETSNNIDKDWYWAAPILLDKLHYPEEYKMWFKNLKNHSITVRSVKEGKENKASKEHIKAIEKVFNDSPENCGLGKMPDNLAKIIMDINFGSPSNCILRSLMTYFPWKGNHLGLLNTSLDLAYDFMLFFDKPEAINAIQINEALKDKRIKENKNKTDIQWNLVLRYCIDGNLLSVLQEYSHMLYSKNKTIESLGDSLAKGLNIRTSIVKVEGLEDNSLETKNLRCHYAVNFGNQNLETEKGVSRAGDIINNFNSPFRPFVLASTSLGQEGLDFHYYARKIMHWNLPRNPVEFEQREGRINRFKGLVIRQNIANKYKGKLKNNGEVWKELFDIAVKEECKNLNKPEIIPFWYTEAANNLKIERIIPLIPLSKDVSVYKELISILAIYRLTFGQPRQEELIKAIKSKMNSKEKTDELYGKLLLKLCPYYFE